MAKQPTKKELANYRSEYSDNKFWAKVGAVAKKAGAKVIYMALLLFYTMKEPSTPAKDKALIIGALGYFILPIDLIPDVIPVLGFTDDLGALTIAYNSIKNNITPEIEAKAQAKVDEWFA